MAYGKRKMLDMSLEAIEKHKLLSIQEIFIYTPFCSSTFYHNELEKSEEIKELIEKNKIAMKLNLKKKWYESNNATLQLCLYKLLSTPEEHKLLTQNNVDYTSRGDKIDNKIMVEIVDKDNVDADTDE